MDYDFNPEERRRRRAASGLLLVLAVLVGWLSMADGPARAMSTTSATAATFTYDAPLVARVDVPAFGAAEAGPGLLDSVRDSAFHFVEARGTSTTPHARSVATEAEAQGGVYSLRDPETGAVVRTGRSNNLAVREAAHANDPVLGDYEFQVEYRTDVYAEQRGLEHELYNRYPEAMSENGGFNKIRAISPTNPRLPGYVQAANDYLSRFGPS